MPPSPTSLQIKDLQLTYALSILKATTCQIRLCINSEQSSTTAWHSIAQDQESGVLRWKEHLISDLREKIQISFEIYVGGVVRPKLLMKGSTEFVTTGQKTGSEVVTLMSIASFMRKGAKIDDCTICFTWKVISEDVRASIIATTPLLETISSAVAPPPPVSPSLSVLSSKASAEKVKQVSSFLEKGIVDLDEENESDSDSDSASSKDAPKPKASSATGHPPPSHPATRPSSSGTLQDHLHKIAASAGSFDDNESSVAETASNLGSESAQSDDLHSVHEFDENDVHLWLADQQPDNDTQSSKAAPIVPTGMGKGIATGDESLPPQVLSFYRNAVNNTSDDNNDDEDAAASLFLSNVEESDDDGEDVSKRVSSSTLLTPSSSIKSSSTGVTPATPALSTPGTTTTKASPSNVNIPNPFLAQGMHSSDDEDAVNTDKNSNKSSSQAVNRPVPTITTINLPTENAAGTSSQSPRSPRIGGQKVRFNDGLSPSSSNPSISSNNIIESTIDPQTQELLLHSVRRAQSFVKDTLDLAPVSPQSSGRLSPVPTTNSTGSNTAAATPTVVEIIKAKVEMDPLPIIELPTKEDVDELFREAAEMRSHLEHELKRNDAECKFLESQLQLLLDTPISEGDAAAAKETRDQYDYQRNRLHELEKSRTADINQLQIKWLKVKEVGHLMHQESIQARTSIFAEENKTKAFHSHYHNLEETIDQIHLKQVCMLREQELQALYDWSQEVVSRLETLENFEKEFQKIRERYEGLRYFVPEFHIRYLKPLPPPPPPQPPAPVAAPALIEKKATSEALLSIEVPTPPPSATNNTAVILEPPMEPVLTPKQSISKALSQRMSVFQAPPVSSEPSPTTVPVEKARAAKAHDISGNNDDPTTAVVPKKRVKLELGALVNEVLMRRGSACPYGVPPKRNSETNGGDNEDDSNDNSKSEIVSFVPQMSSHTSVASSSSALRSIFMPTGDSSEDNPGSSTWSSEHGLMSPSRESITLNSITPFSPIASASHDRRGSENESVITNDDRHTPVLDTSMSKLSQKRLSLSDRKKSRTSMSGLGSPLPNTEAIRVVTSLTKSLKKKYTSDNLADLVAMSRAANKSVPDPTSSPDKAPNTSPLKRDSLPKTPEKEEFPELENVLDLVEIPLSSIVVPPKPVESPVKSALTIKPGPINTSDTLLSKQLSPAMKALLGDDGAVETGGSNNPSLAIQPKLEFTKLDSQTGAGAGNLRSVSPMFSIKEDDVDDEDDLKNGSKNMKHFYQGVLDIVGDGIRSGVLRVFRIMEITLVSSTNSVPNSSSEYKSDGNRNNSSNGSVGGGNNKRRNSTLAGGNSASSTASAAATARNTLIHNALSQRRKAMNMQSSDSVNDVSRSPSNETIMTTNTLFNTQQEGRLRTLSKDGTSPDKSVPKTHVTILPQLPFYDTRTLLDTLSQRNMTDMQLKHHAMVMLSNTLHLNNIEDMLIHVRALQEAHTIFINNDAELVSGKLWDISHLFQAARVLIHLFGTEAAHGRGSVSGSMADHEHALTLDAAAAYQALRNLKEELQRCLLLQNAALSGKSPRSSIRRRSEHENAKISPRTSIIRGSLLITSNNNRHQPLTVSSLISESEGLQAQMLSQLLPHNMAAAELMVRLLAFRDGLLSQSRQYKSLGRREIYRFLKRFGFAIEQQLDIDVHAQNMEVTTSIKPISNQIASALEELDKVEQENVNKSHNSNSHNNSSNALLAATSLLNGQQQPSSSHGSSASASASASAASLMSAASSLPQNNPILLNKLQQQQSLASGSNHTNQTNTGRFCLDRLRSLVLHADEVLYRMRIMKETLLSLAANDSESDTDYDEDDEEEDEDGELTQNNHQNSNDDARSLSQFSGNTNYTSKLQRRQSNVAKPLPTRIRRTRDKELLERAMQNMIANRDELKKKVATMMTSTMSDDVDVLIKSHVSTEEGLANKLFDASFRKEDSSVAVLLLRSRNMAILRSIYATWPGLLFEIAITEPPQATGIRQGTFSFNHSSSSNIGSPLIARSSSQSNLLARNAGGSALASPSLMNHGNSTMLQSMMRSSATTSPTRTQPAGSVVGYGNSSLPTVHPGIAGLMSPTATQRANRGSFDGDSDVGTSITYGQQHARTNLASPSKAPHAHHHVPNNNNSASHAMEIVYQKYAAKDIDTLVIDFTDTRLLRLLGFKLIQLRDSRMYSWTDLLNAGYPLSEIKPLRAAAAASANNNSNNNSNSASASSATSAALGANNNLSSNVSDHDPLNKLSSGFKLSVDELRLAGYSIEQCIQAGFDASSLRAGGFNELQLVQSGLFTMKQLKKAGCDVQRFALKALFDATNGKYWRRRDGWCTNRPLSEWFGVKLDGAGNVIRIDLRSNELQGRLPEALYLLSHLQYLDLYNNMLSGSLPAEFRKLTMLRDLWLDNNNFGASMRKAEVQVLLPQCRIRL